MLCSVLHCSAASSGFSGLSGHIIAQGGCRAPFSISRNSGKILLHDLEQSQDKADIPRSLLLVPYSSAELPLCWLFLSSGACCGSL